MIAEIPEGMDDPDAVIAKSGPEPVNQLLEQAMPSGAYLVKKLLEAATAAGPVYPKRARDLLTYRELLSPASMLSFDLAQRNEGINLPSQKMVALRAAYTLLAEGVPEEQVRSILSSRYGHVLTLEVKDDG
jgi:DNA primase